MSEWVATGLAWLGLFGVAGGAAWLLICITETSHNVKLIREMLENEEDESGGLEDKKGAQ